MAVSNHQIAEALYTGEASDEIYAQVFTLEELIALWDDYCVYKVDEQGKLIDGASYDDEVYDALDRYGYWDNDTNTQLDYQEFTERMA